MTKQHHDLLEVAEEQELRLERHFHVERAHGYVVGYLFVLLLVTVGASVYSWQHREVVQLERQKQQLSAQLKELHQ